ncbi:hypothetical protein MLD38_004697 [Melastoma candidum]|uniref:Uncharacterized protein n=1 Tax=Melastoma candidum TaxID=119954 RepID=A0ACB9S7C0_9MYRT|nr:hypothetical protein MLD38_004697 [Melastoma candidum]
MLQQGGRRRCEGTAMGVIALDLRPGQGIGPFSLGMPICEAFVQIEQQPNIYDVVHVKYLDEDPLKLDIVISFPDHGFHIRFDPWSQRLRLIEVFDVKRLQLRCSNLLIGYTSYFLAFPILERQVPITVSLGTFMLLWPIISCHLCSCMCIIWANLPWNIRLG